MIDARNWLIRGALVAAMVAAPSAGVAQETEAAGTRSTLTRLAHTVGAALVGGWVGYMGSQVTLSDWEKSSNGEFVGRRAGWVAGGIAAGLVASQFVRSTSSAGEIKPDLIRPRNDRHVLTRAEIERTPANSMYDLLTSARHEWFITRGATTLTEIVSGSEVIIYVDAMRLGSVRELGGISPDLIMSAEFLEPRVATLRYGAGHAHGAIQLRTLDT